ncbi:alpha/beta hydrolase family protein [Antribacter gilvus]|uniref:alpha/beta hydrolase family protein n=1 Tax=Antribacter gilvus TaxID=2304675 RepID=UPI000F7B5910|nr:hypothetical protein [Antribacter gilvus]
MRHLRTAAPLAVLALALAGATAAPVAAAPGPVAVPVAVQAAVPAAAETAVTEHTGTIDGARYRVQVPDDWNGTLLLYSHGHYPGEFIPPEFVPFLLANQEATADALVDRGYALAASLFQNGGLDLTVPTAVQDQLNVLAWFEQNVGEPERTFTYGSSMGVVTALELAEREPERVDGVLAVGGVIDVVGSFDAILDLNLATKVLLTDGTDANGNPVELVHATDPAASRDALMAALAAAAETEEGRARIELIASLHDVTGWYDVLSPEPADAETRARGQAQWLMWAYTAGLGPSARRGWEAMLGGNPSSTFDGDWSERLAQSGTAPEVRAAYAAAGLDLDADLAALDAAPVIPADPAARAALAQHRPEGTTPSPVLTIHTTGDGGAPPSSERSFRDRVAQVGDPSRYRSLYVGRGAHLTVNVAEELVALEALETRVETGRWPSLSPQHLNARAWAHGPGYFWVFDPVTGVSEHDPAFVHLVPPRHARPSW